LKPQANKEIPLANAFDLQVLVMTTQAFAVCQIEKSETMIQCVYEQNKVQSSVIIEVEDMEM